MRIMALGKSIGVAVFEVTLLILGIWLALQLDNWNQARKEAQFELQILQGTEEDLQRNAERLNDMIEMDKELIQGNEYLLAGLRGLQENIVIKHCVNASLPTHTPLFVLGSTA